MLGVIVGGQALGLEGAVFGFLFSARALARLWRGDEQLALPDQWQVHQIWMRNSLMCVISKDRSRLWYFRDEFSGQDWAALRRAAIAQCPKEPVGLSMSR